MRRGLGVFAARRLRAALAGAALLSALPLPAASRESAFEGRWKGEILIPGQSLGFDVDFHVEDDGRLVGDISIPAQGARDLALAGVEAEGDRIRFSIPGVPGDPSFDGRLEAEGARIAGTLHQGGAELDFHLDRADPGPDAREALAGLDDFLDQAATAWKIPGLAVAIVADGALVYARGVGYRDLEARRPMTPDTLFAIGSTTKAMTATLLGLLVDEGEIVWDEPLRTYLPAFRLSDASVSERITPRDLVTHRSGLPRHDLLWYGFNEGTRAEIVGRLAHLELTADLRAEFQYNNLMFLTAGHLIEELTGETWEQSMRRRLFAPLGMERSNLSVLESERDQNFAFPYRYDDERELDRIPFRRIDLVGPAGSVNSSVNEMARWLLFNLNRGRVGEEQLINPATLEEIHSPQMTIAGRPERPDISQATYGMGWMIDTYRSHRRLHHGGGIDGFVTSVMLFPDDDLGMVAFNNVQAPLPSLVNQHAADLLLGLEPVDWSGDALRRAEKGREALAEAEQKKEAARRPGTEPSHPINEYVGVYEHPGYGRLEIETGAGESALQLTYNAIEAPLEHWHFDVWNGAETEEDPTFENDKFLFRSDVAGNIAAVEATLEQRAAPIVFRKQPDRRLYDPEYLERFTGRYSYEITGQTAVIELAGGVLTLTLPGQPRYTLEPDVDGRFVLREARVIRVGFETGEDGTVTKAVFYQPQGVFEAVPE